MSFSLFRLQFTEASKYSLKLLCGNLNLEKKNNPTICVFNFVSDCLQRRVKLFLNVSVDQPCVPGEIAFSCPCRFLPTVSPHARAVRTLRAPRGTGTGKRVLERLPLCVVTFRCSARRKPCFTVVGAYTVFDYSLIILFSVPSSLLNTSTLFSTSVHISDTKG